MNAYGLEWNKNLQVLEALRYHLHPGRNWLKGDCPWVRVRSHQRPKKFADSQNSWWFVQFNHQYKLQLRPLLGRSLQDLLLRLQWKESHLQRLRSVLGRSLQVLLPRLQWKESHLHRLRPVLGRSLKVLLRLQWKEIHSLGKTKCRVVFNIFSYAYSGRREINSIVQFWGGVYNYKVIKCIEVG